jgi:hypothetical protein
LEEEEKMNCFSGKGLYAQSTSKLTASKLFSGDKEWLHRFANPAPPSLVALLVAIEKDPLLQDAVHDILQLLSMGCNPEIVQALQSKLGVEPQKQQMVVTVSEPISIVSEGPMETIHEMEITPPPSAVGPTPYEILLEYKLSGMPISGIVAEHEAAYAKAKPKAPLGYWKISVTFARFKNVWDSVRNQIVAVILAYDETHMAPAFTHSENQIKTEHMSFWNKSPAKTEAQYEPFDLIVANYPAMKAPKTCAFCGQGFGNSTWCATMLDAVPATASQVQQPETLCLFHIPCALVLKRMKFVPPHQCLCDVVGNQGLVHCAHRSSQDQ